MQQGRMECPRDLVLIDKFSPISRLAAANLLSSSHDRFGSQTVLLEQAFRIATLGISVANVDELNRARCQLGSDGSHSRTHTTVRQMFFSHYEATCFLTDLTIASSSIGETV